MCEELIATATATGKVGEEMEQRFAELCEETGITPAVTWNTTYYNATGKQVQLGEIITCTLTHEITLQGFGTFTLPFSVTVTQWGCRVCIGSEAEYGDAQKQKGLFVYPDLRSGACGGDDGCRIRAVFACVQPCEKREGNKH